MWGSTNNAIAIWNFTPGGAFASAQAFGPYPDWFTEGLSISGYDNQQYLFWRKSDGTNVVASLWRLNSSSVFQSAQTLGPYGTRPYDYWEPQWPAISPADGRVWLLWNHFNMWSTNGNEYSLWRFNNMSSFEGATYIPPVGNDWQSTWVTCGRDGKVRLPWVQPVSYPYIGVSVWRLSGTGGFEGARMFGPVPGWIYNGLAPRPDWNQWIVWMSPAYDAISLWQLNNTEGFQSACSYGPYSGWTLNGGDVGGANRTYLLWVHTSRAVSVWRLGPTGTYECSRNYGPY
jgi:hypothetical protein